LITGTSYLDTAISAGSSRDYYVQAFASGNPAGTKSDWGGPNNGTRAVALPLPSTPTGLSATTNRTTDVYISWNASANASTYEIWYGSPPLDSYNADFFPGSATYYFDNGITQGSSRTYYVRARNSVGASSWSAGATGTRTAAVSTPVPVLSSISGNNSLALGGTFSWSFTNSPTGYSILVTGPSGSVYTTSNSYSYGSTSFRPGYDGTGWQGSGNYTIYVNAQNSGGNSLTASLTTFMS
jgi:cellulose 1,4-beta-cellobiosidase